MQKVLKSLALAALAAAAPMHGAAAADQQAALLVYRVWEEGQDPYISRVLITPRYVRMDEGEGGSQYTLYDREQAVIYNVDDEERSILVIDPPATQLPLPDTLKLEQQLSTDSDAPTVAGRQPQRVSLLANGVSCRELVAVPGLLPQAVAGLRDLQTTLGHVQAATLGVIPAEMQSPCDLAENVYAPLRGLDYGLPIQEMGAGRGRALVDFSADHKVSDGLFALPADYSRTSMGALAAGAE
jgi:hypothetical protein